ncbi:hypothetical protein Q9295_02775 [Xinfangfangia sp. CPCC 101601]|uniref:Magnesium transporter MgtE intracellular domain-containing protein n=1 Tax=Pseudogemmobacter lacusdianii TaxID=3069608 RepID=A0ABU0VU80_9RHOB|nr:hypothetical protein [Xinfangfangia sp. CPCC 101601]MDQ2065286.1 hypothetical protein [Xinfangfangia sp. CPCC 101601]
MRRRAGRGALLIIALMFASSGALRLGSSLGTALAENAKAEAGSKAAEPLQEAVVVGAECPLPPAALAAALSEREGRLRAREAALADREAALALADEAVSSRLTALEAAELELRKTLALADGAAEADITRLVAVYETMKPKDAARLFDAMDPDFASGFMGRMRPDAAAAVLSGMQAEKAYAVSAILAGRNSAAPKD